MARFSHFSAANIMQFLFQDSGGEYTEGKVSFPLGGRISGSQQLLPRAFSLRGKPCSCAALPAQQEQLQPVG